MNRGDDDRNSRSSHSNGYISGVRAQNASSLKANLIDHSPSRDMGGDDQEFADVISWRAQNGNYMSRRAGYESTNPQERERPDKCRSAMFYKDGY